LWGSKLLKNDGGTGFSFQLGTVKFKLFRVGSIHRVGLLNSFNDYGFVCSCFLTHYLLWGRESIQHNSRPLQIGLSWDARCICGVKCNSCDVNVLYAIEPYHSVDSFFGFFLTLNHCLVMSEGK